MAARFHCLAALLIALPLLAPATLLADPNADGPKHDRYHLSVDQLDEAFEVLREIKPELAERLEPHRQDDPQRVVDMLQREFPHVRHLIRLKRVAPETYNLRVQDVKLTYQSQQLAEQLQQAEQDPSSGDAAALGEQLRQVVEQHFDVRQQLRERELAYLERRIGELRAQLDERAQDKEALIEQRLNDLAAEESDAGEEW